MLKVAQYWQIAVSRVGREVLTVLLWGLAISGIYMQALYRRPYVTLTDQLMVFAICLLASAAMVDVGRAVLGYFAAIAIGMGVVYAFATLPIQEASLQPASNFVVDAVWLAIVFKSVFPFPFILYLLASIVGSLLGERYL